MIVANQKKEKKHKQGMETGRKKEGKGYPGSLVLFGRKKQMEMGTKKQPILCRIWKGKMAKERSKWGSKWGGGAMCAMLAMRGMRAGKWLI